MTRDFFQRFNLQIELKEAQRRFINRIRNTVFDALYWRLDEDDRSRVQRSVATALGEHYVWNRGSVKEYVGNDFLRALRAVEAFYNTLPGLRTDITTAVMWLLQESEVPLSIRWEEGRFFPEGSPFLDEKLVNNILGQLRDRGYKTALEPFEKGVRHLLDSGQRPELRADVITDMYESVEALAKIVTGRPERDLSANQELFISRIKVSPRYKALLKAYVEYGCEFRHAVTETNPRPSISAGEAESFVYLTGLFLRMGMQAG